MNLETKGKLLKLIRSCHCGLHFKWWSLLCEPVQLGACVQLHIPQASLFTRVLSTMQYQSSSLLCKYPIHIRLLPHFCGDTWCHTLNTALFFTANAARLDSDAEQYLFLELFVPVSVKVVRLLGQDAFFGTSFWLPTFWSNPPPSLQMAAAGTLASNYSISHPGRSQPYCLVEWQVKV